MKKTFVLGSGFSKDIAGFPLLAELSDQVLAKIQAGPKTPTTQYLIEIVPESIKANVEHLLTYLLQNFPWRSDEETHLSRAAYSVVAKAVSDLFAEIDDKVEELSEESAAVRLVRLWHKLECDIITFNYDTLVERLAINKLRRKRHLFDAREGNLESLTRIEMTVGAELPSYTEPINDFAFEWEQNDKILTIILEDRDGRNPNRIANKVLPQVGLTKDSHEWRHLVSRFTNGLRALDNRVSLDNLYQIPINHVNARTASLFSGENSETLRLLKLHGSVNWLFSGGADYSGEQLYYTNPFRGGHRTAQLATRNARDLVPLIVPPILDKSVFYMNNSMKTQWSLAREALLESKEIYVIGYSLPETDLSTRFLLTEAMTRGSAQLYLVTRGKPGNLAARYQGVADPKRIHCIWSDGSSIEKLMDCLENS